MSASGLQRIFVGGVHCLNLDRETERWETTRAHLASFGIDTQRFAATDGAAITIEQAQADGVIGPKGLSSELLSSRGAVGLAYTTRRLWKMIASCDPTPLQPPPNSAPLTKSEQRWFLIVEDDVVLDDALRDHAFAEYLWSRIPEDADLVYFGFSGGYGGLCGQRRLADIVAERTTSVNAHVLHVHGTVTGAFAYAITPRTAHRLLELITPFYRPIDYFPCNHLRMYAFKSFVTWPTNNEAQNLLRTDGRTWLCGLASVRPIASTIRSKQANAADANAMDEVRGLMAEHRYAEASDRLRTMNPSVDVMSLLSDCAHHIDGASPHELLGYTLSTIRPGADNASRLAHLARWLRNKHNANPLCFAAALVARQLALADGANDTNSTTLFIADDEMTVSGYYVHPSLREHGRIACARALANAACPAASRSRVEYNLRMHGGTVPPPPPPPPPPTPAGHVNVSAEAAALLREQVPNIVWCFWNGPPMSPTRAACFEALKQNAGVPVLLVTPDNVASYVLPTAPLHPAYEHLSYVHRSDYLRCYMLHHYGGAYHDVKACGPGNDFGAALQRLRDDPNIFMVGYPEIDGGTATIRDDPVLTQKLRDHSTQLVGMGTLATRKQTPLSTAWFERVNALLDEKLSALQSNALTDPIGYQRGTNNPLGYLQLLGEILHPLMLEYIEHLHQGLVIPCCTNYR